MRPTVPGFDPVRRRVLAGAGFLLLPRVSSASVDAVLDDAVAVPALRGLLVAREGALVAERY